MGLDFTFNIQYDSKKDIYFINGQRCEVNEQKSLVEPSAMLVKVLRFSSRQFTDLRELTNTITAMNMHYIIRGLRPSDKGNYF